jgi:alpha-amylase
MTPHIRLALVLHQHQPIGNFDHVVEQAYRDAYLPVLQTFARHPSLRLSLHLSGSLYDWLVERHPEYLEQVAALERQGRVEVIGGAYYEPILTMIPRRDRLAQITRYSDALAERFENRPTGCWLPERVWEQSLASDLAESGVGYTIVDDYHFRRAGLAPEQLFGYYLTEDDGKLLAVLPGSERLRYLLPFAAPEEAIDYLRTVAVEHPGATIVFADDGEKFGSWPGTRELCHEHGWLNRFCELLEANPWIETTTPGDVIRTVEPQGKIYLPDGSYREMTEWSSLASQTNTAENTATPGTWRNFLVKYPESAEMYARMHMVSDRVARAEQLGYPADVVAAAQTELFKAQCNCAYWHGSFAGVYLSHLRQAVYRHLIRADDILDRTADRPEHWVEATVRDYNLDVRPEICLSGDRLTAFLAPHDGGRLYELDVRGKAHNLLATASGRSEPYHAPTGTTAACGNSSRKCLTERFYDACPTLEEVAEGRAVDLGDFAGGAYRFHVDRHVDSTSVRMWRTGRIAGLPVTLTKTVTLAAGGETLVCDYRLDNLPRDRDFHLAVEFNFAGFTAEEGRALQQLGGKRLGELDRPLEFPNLRDMQLSDELAGLRVGLSASRPASWFAYPVRVLNRWEAGLETTQQATCLVPHWRVQADADGSWCVTITMPIEATAGLVAASDLGDRETNLVYPRVEIVTETEVVRGKPQVQRKTTRRLKKAG